MSRWSDPDWYDEPDEGQPEDDPYEDTPDPYFEDEGRELAAHGVEPMVTCPACEGDGVMPDRGREPGETCHCCEGSGWLPITSDLAGPPDDLIEMLFEDGYLAALDDGRAAA